MPNFLLIAAEIFNHLSRFGNITPNMEEIEE